MKKVLLGLNILLLFACSEEEPIVSENSIIGKWRVSDVQNAEDAITFSALDYEEERARSYHFTDDKKILIYRNRNLYHMNGLNMSYNISADTLNIKITSTLLNMTNSAIISYRYHFTSNDKLDLIRYCTDIPEMDLGRLTFERIK